MVFECHFGGFNYSKMVKNRFLIDSNIFWMDFGTWKISRFFGPVVDPWTPYLSWIYFNKYKTNFRNILEKYGLWISENLRISECPEVLCTWLFDFWNFEIWRFEDLKIWNFDNYNMIIWWNHEKSKTRNLLTFIFPAEFLQKLEYGFGFDKKTWIDFVQQRTNFCIFGQVHP